MTSTRCGAPSAATPPRSAGCSTRSPPARARDQRLGHDLRRRQSAGRLARTLGRRARCPPVRSGVVVPGAKQPGPAAGAGRADSRSGGRRPRTSARSSPRRSCRASAARTLPGSEFSIETSIVPVALRLQFEGASDAGPDAFVIRSSDQRAAGRGDRVAMRTCRTRGSGFAIGCCAAELALAAVAAAAASRGPLLDWRRVARSAGAADGDHAVDCAVADRRARRSSGSRFARPGLAEFSLLPSAPWSRIREPGVRVAARLLPERAGGRRPGDAGGVEFRDVARRASSRHRRRGRRSARSRAALFYVVQLAAGLGVAALVMSYEWLLRTYVSQTPVDIVRFAIDRFDSPRLLVIVGLIALNAAVVGLAILLYRLAWSPWVFPSRPDGRGARADSRSGCCRRRSCSACSRPPIARRSGRRCWSWCSRRPRPG